MSMRSGARDALVAALFFAVLTAVWWWPVVSTISTQVAGAGGDPFQTLWRFVRFGEVLAERSLVIPEEQHFKNFGPLPWLLVHALFGEVVAYNTAWLVSAFLSGWCTTLLARAWGARLGPALLAGLLVVWSPYRLAQALGHFGSLQLWWIPAVLLALTLWMRTQKFRWAVVSGVLIVGTAWTEHQLFLSLWLTLVVIGAWFFREALKHLRRAWTGAVVLSVIVIGGAFLPFLGEIVATGSKESSFNLGDVQRQRFSASPQTLFVPPPFHALRQGVAGYETETGTSADHVHGVGMLLSALAVMCVLRWRKLERRDRALLVLAAVGLLLALGPALRVGQFSLPLPGVLIGDLPVVSALRTLGRFVAVAVIALPLLAARQLRWIVPQAAARSVIAGLLILEILPAVGFPRLPVDRALADQLRNLPAGALLVIPATTNPRVGSEHLYLSTLHGHPTVANIALERAQDPEELAALLKMPVLGDLALLRTDDLKTRTFFGQELAAVAPVAFASAQVRAVVLDRDPPGGLISRASHPPRVISAAEREQIVAFLRDTLGLEEVPLDARRTAYRILDPSPGASVVASRGQGWTLVTRSTDCMRTRVEGSAVLHLDALSSSPPVTFVARVADGEGMLTVEESSRTLARVHIVRGATLRVAIPAREGRTTMRLVMDRPPLVLDNPTLQTAGRLTVTPARCASSS